jgi:hypothetical protein|tara:strand:- start:1878 stop:1982 length:105 start_codon:yes stop_codon:yes gene_type:complete
VGFIDNAQRYLHLVDLIRGKADDLAVPDAPVKLH